MADRVETGTANYRNGLRRFSLHSPPFAGSVLVLLGAGVAEPYGRASLWLWALQVIADGTVSLAELEQQDPILGRNFKDFITTINRCCPHAYERFSVCLEELLTLPSEPSETMKAAVVQKLSHASDDVARTCNELAALADAYDADIRKHASEPQAAGSQKRHSLMMLLMVLHKHERYLKQDIQHAVDVLKMDVANSQDQQRHASTP